MGEVTADLLKKIGMTVDFVATDWGTVGQRRASKNPPGQGGWGMFHTWHAGADCVNPAAYIAIRANGEKAWFGWPDSPEVEKEVAAWFDAKDLDEEKAVDRAASTRRRWSTSSTCRPASTTATRPGARNVERRRQGPAAVLLGRDEGVRALPLRIAGWSRTRTFHARLHRPTHPGDDPRDGDRRPVRVQPALHRARRSGGGDRRRPGHARGRREDPHRASASTGRSSSASASGPGSILHGDLGTSIFTNLPVTELIAPAHRADAVADGGDAHPRGRRRRADGRGRRLEGRHLDRPRA